MERIINVGIVFAAVTMTCLAVIKLTGGTLDGSTIIMLVMLAVVTGVVAGTWTAVNAYFPNWMEMRILILIIIAVMIGFGAREILGGMGVAIADGSAWWLLAPVVCTAGLSYHLGLLNSSQSEPESGH